MSIYTQTELNDGVVTGFLDEHIFAWHQAGIDPDELRRLGRAFDGPVPATVAEHLIGWEPVVIEQNIVVGDDGEVYEVPDRFRKVVANPNTHRVVNVAGSGYKTDLHLIMREAIETVLSTGAQIASVVCLGDGAHLGMSFRSGDSDVVIGGSWGGVTPLVGFNSSLSSAIATSLDTSTTLRVCDNTMRAAAANAYRAVKIKRTRFSEQKITPSMVRQALEISYKQSEELVAELERLANIEVTNAQIADVLDAWRPIGEQPDSRSASLARSAHREFRTLLNGRRNPFGYSVAGLLQTHNTYQHWAQPAKGVKFTHQRLGRMAMRDAAGDVDAADAAFAKIVRELIPA